MSREIIYEERRRVLDGENMRDSIFHMMNEYVENLVDMVTSPDQDYDEWNLSELNMTIHNTIPMAPITEEDVKEYQPEGVEASAERTRGESL